MNVPIAKMIDHTLLKPEATEAQIKQLVNEAKKYRFASVCVQPTWVKTAKELLEEEKDIKVCTVIGFPTGATTTEVKVFEAKQAVGLGAEEIDMVINIGALKDRREAYVEEEIQAIVEAVKNRAIVKVIIETCLLTKEEKIRACTLAKNAGAHFVKTSTGFSSGGATVEDVRLMREAVGEKMGVKASGGIRDRKTAEAMIQAGATRIGTSSGVVIVTEPASS